MQTRVPSETPQLFSVLGLPVHLLNNYSNWLTSRAQQRIGCHVVTLNAEMTMQAEENPPLASIIHQADLVIPDGAGIVLYLRLHGRQMQRCPGIELSEALLQNFGQSPSLGSVFFFGGAPGVAQKAVEVWQEKVPGLAIAGTQHGYLSPEEEPVFHQRLKSLQPRLILVGLGVPRQEFWIAEHRALCPNAIWIGVGGSFDTWAGVKTRAPEWLRNNHLEWIYRLYQEPWRWRRMLALPKFALRALVYRLTQRLPVSSQG
ncbi:WecB/TagA/CpsF family glycosyltransferase [Kovacikia minuta CCNUW1]|uniref:WecB/TagA/CpsF family glycosyltransferase n=1 Tax=Kovacikia minuta TaxID=2931930 RepID=UPI001CCBA45B|nr:WecB/TagA/CpsF family glycosyltransferase [Kovacikia minuta]UBF25139.1 WecB/TagA/CpsF family glycosyltransferase [Kovacikia minuta CCNUW1]